MTTTTECGFSQQAFDAFLAARNEPAWVTEQRQAAWDHFLQMDWPGRREEEWIRTDIRLFKLDKYNMPIGEAADANPTALLSQGVELAGHNRSTDSRSQNFELSEKWKAKGVVFGSLDQLLADHEDIIRKHMLSMVCLLYTSPSPRDATLSRMPSSA